MTAYLIVAVAAFGLLLVRSLPLIAGSTGSMPRWLRASLGLVGPAALGAIVTSMTLTTEGNVSGLDVPLSLAAVGSFLAVRRSGNILFAYAAGFPLYWLTLASIG